MARTPLKSTSARTENPKPPKKWRFFLISGAFSYENAPNFHYITGFEVLSSDFFKKIIQILIPKLVQFFMQKTIAIFFEYDIISISNEREVRT